MKIQMFWDNITADLNAQVQEWLDANPGITIHFVTQSESQNSRVAPEYYKNVTYGIMYSGAEEQAGGIG